MTAEQSLFTLHFPKHAVSGFLKVSSVRQFIDLIDLGARFLIQNVAAKKWKITECSNLVCVWVGQLMAQFPGVLKVEPLSPFLTYTQHWPQLQNQERGCKG